MAIPTTYLPSSGKLKGIMEDILRAGDPDRFTYEFLKQIGHASSADRPVIPVLKALGFLTDSGTPTERYRRYKDTAQSKAVMAEAVRDAYADVFKVDQKANTKTAKELKGVFARLSGKGDSVNEKMALTFKALTDLADFSVVPAKPEVSGNGKVDEKPPPPPPEDEHETETSKITLRHDVHVHLPISTDIKVYDAIFRALRENLG
jgi:hypothetical protein